MQKSTYNEINKIIAKNNKKNILNIFKNYWGSINLQLIISNIDNNEISFLLINILPFVKK